MNVNWKGLFLAEFQSQIKARSAVIWNKSSHYALHRSLFVGQLKELLSTYRHVLLFVFIQPMRHDLKLTHTSYVARKCELQACMYDLVCLQIINEETMSEDEEEDDLRPSCIWPLQSGKVKTCRRSKELLTSRQSEKLELFAVIIDTLTDFIHLLYFKTARRDLIHLLQFVTADFSLFRVIRNIPINTIVSLVWSPKYEIKEVTLTTSSLIFDIFLLCIFFKWFDGVFGTGWFLAC